MTLEYLQSYVGRPVDLCGGTYQRTIGALVTWGWRDMVAGKGGWWCAVTSGDVVLELAWTIGGANQRNEELRRLVARHAGAAQVSA